MLGKRLRTGGLGLHGGNSIPTIASAATLNIQNDIETMYISGTTAVTKISTGRRPGRKLRFIGTDATGNVFTNTNDTTVEGEMDLGGSNVTLAAQDILELVQNNNGSFTASLHKNN